VDDISYIYQNVQISIPNREILPNVCIYLVVLSMRKEEFTAKYFCENKLIFLLNDYSLKNNLALEVC